ncbi:DUF418 domain-containing protein [Dyella terrae]|uniref:DUF418 domain-containing protein n=1 Tax=Dyella terrae TaxID=522259 RepID=UPI001EFD8517|nr:DUF418 domain-containing protein [Dyella terrae]ULU24980.1 DUF418 protein [Dyella terrae]
MSLDTTEEAGLSTKSVVKPVNAKDRIHAIDMLRGIALFGVLAVNLVEEFRVSLFQQFLPTQPLLSPIDSTLQNFISIFLEMKAFALFSILFGVGLAIQSERLGNSGSRLRLLMRRLLALLAIGLVHLLLIWNGDILTEYALAGFVVLPLLWLPTWSTALAAFGLLALYIAMPALPIPIPWPSLAMMQQHVLEANSVYATGSYGQILRFSWNELPYVLPLHEFVFSRTLGLFAVGMLAWRAGVLRSPHRHKALLLVVIGLGLTLGLLLNSSATIHAVTSWNMPAVTASCLSNAAGIFMGLGYAAAVISLVEFTSARSVLGVFAPLGRMAFTNYLLQSVIFSWVFFGYGLGYFGRFGLAGTLLFGTVVYGSQMVFSVWWLRRYRFGPIEWLWRTLMYGVRQPMAISHDIIRGAARTSI